jgi:branched-subunit amino acid ABC-type transport system permease component
VTPALLIDSVLRSIQVGSLYALMALGLTLTLAVTRVPNFAHAELITVGAYAGLLVSLVVPANLPIVLIAALAASAAVAWLCHRLAFRPLGRQNLGTYSLILASFAVGLIVRYLIFLFVDRFDLFDRPMQLSQRAMVRGPGFVITNTFAYSVAIAVILVIGLSALLKRTSLGRDMRAVAANSALAGVIGVSADRVKDMTWLIVGALAGVGGALWGLYTSINPLIGFLSILSVFAATVLGGMTSFAGTILGAFVVAFSENVVMQFLNATFGLDFSFKPAIPFIIIILVLLMRPQGLTRG